MRYRISLDFEPDLHRGSFRGHIRVDETGLVDPGRSFCRDFEVEADHVFEFGALENHLKHCTHDLIRFIRNEKKKLDKRNEPPWLILGKALDEWRKRNQT